METRAIVLHEPHRLAVETVRLTAPAAEDVTVDVHHTGISAGTERLFYDGAMPPFPGMGYPLVPGYETVGRVVDAPAGAAVSAGDAVFVPGAHCFEGVRALFGGAAKTLFVPAARAFKVDHADPEACLMALAATAHHAIATGGHPGLVIGNGVLGRLIARIATALGNAPVVHEVSAARRDGPTVVSPDDDPRRDYRTIIDASGSTDVMDTAVSRLAKGGTLTLAGFYGARMSFAFPPAFMKEARFVVSAEWNADDLTAVRALLDSGRLSLAGLITHTSLVADAPSAYARAFTDPACLKMILDWKDA